MATPDIRTEWGTQRRLAETMRHVDDSDIDELIDRFTRLGGGPRFFAKFHPQASWLWRQYHGTVLQHTWKPACLAMVLAFATVHYMESDGRDWPKFGVPHEKAVAQLLGLERAWSYVLTFATFINSFFLSQSYGFWLANKGNTRKVQGRLNDLSCLLATHAERDEQGRFTERARALLDEMARWVRLFHILFWAGQVRPARADEGASHSRRCAAPPAARPRHVRGHAPRRLPLGAAHGPRPLAAVRAGAPDARRERAARRRVVPRLGDAAPLGPLHLAAVARW